jgi:hypothetical protein
MGLRRRTPFVAIALLMIMAWRSISQRIYVAMTTRSTRLARRCQMMTSNAGLVNGNDREFTTSPVPPPPVETPAQPPTTAAPAAQPVLPPASASPPKAIKCKKGFQKKKVRGKVKCVKVKQHRKSGS